MSVSQKVLMNQGIYVIQQKSVISAVQACHSMCFNVLQGTQDNVQLYNCNTGYLVRIAWPRWDELEMPPVFEERAAKEKQGMIGERMEKKKR